MKNKKLFFLTLILMIIGVGVSIKLLHIDYNVAFDPNFKPTCDLSKTVSCSAVAESKYAFILGIPVASYGIMGYLLMIAYLLFSRKREDLYNNLFIFLSIFSAVSLYFFLIAKVVLNATCIYCFTTYMINWGLTAVVGIYLFGIKRRENTFSIITSIKTLFGVPIKTIPVYGVIFLGVMIPSYINFPGKMALICETVGAKCPNGTCMIMHGKPECFCDMGYRNSGGLCVAEGEVALTSPYPGGTFDNGDMVGIVEPEKVAVTMVVYSDYECPFCSRFEETLQRCIRELDGIKLIRKEFPMDKSCNMMMPREFHQHACDAAKFAKCAGVQGKFWEATALLHHNRKKLDKDNYSDYMEQLQLSKEDMAHCMKSETVVTRLKADILEGMKLGIKGTPSSTFNGELIPGNIPYADLKKILMRAGATPKITKAAK